MRIFNLILTVLFMGTHLWAGNASTLAEAKTLSTKTNKPILIDFMTET